ncbi:MAG: hypothetical protein J07HB67_01495 [halophilic archaeon J07HB67]|jgi:hypothetical protein|nr:MAG: hypothetical protein J07HB67_01495 [halophilic archaeon J07HB67]
MASEARYPILADTSSLIAVANTNQWESLRDAIHLTTTNVCKHELRNHVESTNYPPEGSREHYLKRGSERVIAHLETDSSPWSCVTVVPRPHGADAGEQSLEQELAEHGAAYRVVTILDSAARRSIRRLVEEHEHDIDVVGPPYLLYVLLDNDLLSKPAFCEATVEMIRTEGWTGYETVKSAWSGIPIDCADILGDEHDDVLPPQ